MPKTSAPRDLRGQQRKRLIGRRRDHRIASFGSLGAGLVEHDGGRPDIHARFQMEPGQISGYRVEDQCAAARPPRSKI